MIFGIQSSVERRIDDFEFRSFSPSSRKIHLGSRDTDKVAESRDRHTLLHSQVYGLVNESGLSDADRTSGSGNQFDIVRQDIPYTELENRVCVRAAHFHHADRSSVVSADNIECSCIHIMPPVRP